MQNAPALILGLLCLTGCGTLVNQNPNANFDVDFGQCNAEAHRVYPVVYGTYTTQGSSESDCRMVGNTLRCNGTSTAPRTVSNGIDQNLGDRIGYRSTCLRGRGWVRQ